MISILLVEDDDKLNKVVSVHLANSGFDVNSAYDGFELAQEVRLFNKSIPIIFMTAREDIRSKQLWYQTGIDDYIVKPVDLDELILKNWCDFKMC